MGRRDKLLSGSVDEQLNKVDTILRRLMRRSGGNVATVYVPPIPVMSSGYDNETGVIIKAVIPSSGVITSIAIFAEMAKGVNMVEFEAELKSPSISNTVKFNVKHTLTKDDINISVAPGDVLTIRAVNPEDVVDAAASALYKISPSETTIHKRMVEEIDKLEDSI